LKATGAIPLRKENNNGSTDTAHRKSDEGSEDNWKSTFMYAITYTQVASKKSLKNEQNTRSPALGE